MYDLDKVQQLDERYNVGTKTEILTDGDPLDAILAGAEKLYKAVSTTMGPRGGNVIFRKYGRKVGVTHDGVTVAKLVRDDDEAQDVAIDVIREAAMKLDATTGDGTTTVTVLTYHILKEAIAQIKQGENPMKLRLALDALQQTILDQIDEHTDKDVTEKKLIDVASVASGSKLIGEEVGKTIFKAGADTPIMLGFSDSSQTYSEVIDGFKIDAGAASPYLMQGAGVKLELVEPYVIVVDAKLRDKEDILPILRVIASIPDEKRNVLLVTSDIAGDAMNYLVMNHLKGFARIACARVPEHIQAHSEYLSDVAVACGAKVLSRNSGNTIKEPNLEQFGRADKVTVEPRETVIIGGKRIAEDFAERIASLKDFAESYKTKLGRKFADDRLKTLEQKVVSIFVGGQSETDAEERHYRYEDAVGASRSALRSGTVAGGGTLLYSIGDSLLFGIKDAQRLSVSGNCDRIDTCNANKKTATMKNSSFIGKSANHTLKNTVENTSPNHVAEGDLLSTGIGSSTKTDTYSSESMGRETSSQNTVLLWKRNLADHLLSMWKAFTILTGRDRTIDQKTWNCGSVVLDTGREQQILSAPTAISPTCSSAQMILSKALKSPLNKVLENAGIEHPHDKEPVVGWGYDVMHPEDGVIDLVERGIVDPAESEIECVKTAITVAGLLMTSGAMIIDRGAPDEQASTTPNFN